MLYRITVLPQKRNIEAKLGETLLTVLQRSGVSMDAPCGGNGTCGKCRVLVEGKWVPACQTVVDRDMTVTLPADRKASILSDGTAHAGGDNPGYALAFDIGTTTVAGYLLAPGGAELAKDSAMNPQIAFGADVVTRIRHALDGQREALTDGIRRCADKIGRALCQKCGIFPEQIDTISVVGNPTMQQLFLGIRPDNLAQIPFDPVLTRAERVAAAPYSPRFSKAELLIVPNISGFVGADTLACLLAADMDCREELCLLVDIGTNGEMVMGNRHGLVACATAAGPALEGAGIRFGMRAMDGAIDHVRRTAGGFDFTVIGGGEPVGICGSGLIDAVAAALDAGLLNRRGKIENEQRTLALTGQIHLTKEDIRQVQQAKGAIAAGIRLMAEHLGVSLEDLHQVYLAGAFGNYLNPASACRIGLLPPVLEERIVAIGNAAGTGAKQLVCCREALSRTQRLAEEVEYLNLAAMPRFSRCFADSMYLQPPVEYWCQKAKNLGFTEAVPLDVTTLKPREDVRNMCAGDQCGAYGKNWTCPPHCGSLDRCTEDLRRYTQGILLQTVGKTEKIIDTKAYRRTEQQHMEQFYRLCDLLRKTYPDALCLGSGGCRICSQCAWPEPCRYPARACPSMEGYGLFVTQVCRDNGLAYHHGDKTVTYTACILF